MDATSTRSPRMKALAMLFTTLLIALTGLVVTATASQAYGVCSVSNETRFLHNVQGNYIPYVAVKKANGSTTILTTDGSTSCGVSARWIHPVKATTGVTCLTYAGFYKNGTGTTGVKVESGVWYTPKTADTQILTYCSK